VAPLIPGISCCVYLHSSPFCNEQNALALSSISAGIKEAVDGSSTYHSQKLEPPTFGKKAINVMKFL
jgi:hypothetical protein